MAHPLDRPVWSALTGRLAHLTMVDGPACRLDPTIGIWAAAADRSQASVAALHRLAALGAIALIEADEADLPDGLVSSCAACDQMVLEEPTSGDPALEMVALSAADAPAMLALATLTRPGPFFAGTHRLGGFIGVKVDGRLVAMAGERLKPPGYTEISGVCTHPDFRGRGFAAGLIRAVAAGIIARGETPFLQSYSANAAANALYAALGFRLRRVVTLATIG